jgi:hypothetical protein
MRVIALACRRSERRYWAGMLFNSAQGADRERRLETIRAAKYAIEARQTNQPVELHSDDRKKIENGDVWQATYNLACYFAIRAQAGGTGQRENRETAVRLLERIMEKDDAGQLTVDWVDNDPDLKALVTSSRYASFRGWLPKKRPRGLYEE